MIYDENKDGKIIDLRYVNEDLITRYKLVCENDVDTNSFPEADQNLINEFIEIGLESNTEREAIKEVKDLLKSFRMKEEGRPPKTNYELLMSRIDGLSEPKGRPYEITIKEHLVGTSEKDPVIQKLRR